MSRKLRPLSWMVPILGGLLLTGCGGGSSSNSGNDAPTLERVVINGGAPYTLTRQISVSPVCTEPESVADVMLSEDPDFAGAEWLGFESPLAVELSPGDGLRAIYCRVRDARGGLSSVVSSEIALAESTTVVGLSPYTPGDALASPEQAATTLELWVANVTGIFSGTFRLAFDPDLLTTTDLDVDFPEHLLRTTGASLIVSNASYDNETGLIQVGALPYQGGFEGVSGSGPFARVTIEPTTVLTAEALVEFIVEEWTAIYVVQAGGPPVPLEDIIFIAGRVEP